MTFATLQTFQAALEASVRELTAKHLSLVQSFAEKQKDTFANPAALLDPQNVNDSQILVQHFVTANQAFIASSLRAAQTYWRDQLAENQATMQAASIPGMSDMAASIPGMSDMAASIQSAVQKATSSTKTIRPKR